MKKLILILTFALCFFAAPISSRADTLSDWTQVTPDVSASTRSSYPIEVSLYNDATEEDYVYYAVKWNVELRLRIANLPSKKALKGRVIQSFIINVPDASFVGLAAADRYNIELTCYEYDTYFGTAGINMPVEVGNGSSGNKEFDVYCYMDEEDAAFVSTSGTARVNYVNMMLQVQAIYYDETSTGFSVAALMAQLPPCNIAVSGDATSQLYAGTSQYDMIGEIQTQLDSIDAEMVQHTSQLTAISSKLDQLIDGGDSSGIDQSNQEFADHNSAYQDQEGILMDDAAASIDDVDMDTTSFISSYAVSTKFFMDLLDGHIDNSGGFWLVVVFGFLLSFVFYILRLRR